MSTNELSKRECIDARDARALSECMSVLDEQDPRVQDADDLYLVVSQSGREYLVDLRERVCECKDFEHNLPDGDRHACKHITRVTYETSARPIPGWIDRNALDDQIGMHIDATPRVARSAVATDGGQLEGHDEDQDDERPNNCECAGLEIRARELCCWNCWRAGFETPNPEVTDR